MREYTTNEIMAVAAAREIRDGELALIGMGLPQVAGFLAKCTHAPNAHLLFEIGVLDPEPIHQPVLDLGDPTLWYRAHSLSNLLDVLGMGLATNRVDLGFLGAAMIDPYGSTNTMCIGDYRQAKVYFRGSGGANDISSMARRIVIMMRHEKRKFAERIDHITCPGRVVKGKDRRALGLTGGGPQRVITDLAVMGFHEGTNRMMILSVHPGVTVEQVLENTGFSLLVADNVAETPPPTPHELALLRQKIDPTGHFLKSE